MRTKSEFTIIERAVQTIDGFSAVDERIRQQTILRGQSRSTFENYIRQIARICLHFGRLPEAITEEEINEYLTGLARDPKSPSRSQFKHAIYGQRYYYRNIGHNDSVIQESGN